jgi:hypothetical protein
MRTTHLSTEDCADALEQDAGSNIISTSDRRLRELKNRIMRDEKDEKTFKHKQIAARISKRIALAELVGRYIDERDARRALPKKRRKKQLPQSSPKDRFTDLLFPQTLNYNGDQMSTKAQGLEAIEETCSR